MITNITIADDDPDTREFVRHVLSGTRTNIVEAASGDALAALLALQPPVDLLVTDIWMPPLSGLDLVARARGRGFATPTLFITGADDPELVRRVAQVGTARLLRKPFGLVGLLGAVAHLMDAARSRPSAALPL
ncbi:MAG: response regulator [Deltaproteobacteria bacterium]|nr:response regulator [Deltaproteobacteria bacterium]